MNTVLLAELDDLSINELEQLIQSIALELQHRTTAASVVSEKPLDEGEIVQVLAFELKRHRKQKDEVFNPFA